MEFDIEKVLEVDSLDAVPEAFRPLYAAKDNKFVLGETFKPTAGAISALSKSMKAIRDENKGLKGSKIDLSELAEFGATPAEIKAAVAAKIDELTGELAKGKDGKINLEKIKQELAAGHAKELEKGNAKVTALTNQLYDLLVTQQATSAVAEEKGVPELLMPFLKDKVKVIEEDGKFNVFVVDAAGDRRYSGTTGAPMSVKELVKEMKANEKYARLFDSTTNTGGGKQSQSSQQTKTTTTTGELTGIAKIKAGLDKGQAKQNLNNN
jgi:hypothetical protein